MIVVRGMILIHTVPVAEAAVPVTINQDMKALLLSANVNSSYLLWMLRALHPTLLGMVSTAAHGTRKLDTERLESLVVPLAPKSVQAAFAARLVSIVSIQSQQATAIQKAEATFNALLGRVFSEGGQHVADHKKERIAVA